MTTGGTRAIGPLPWPEAETRLRTELENLTTCHDKLADLNGQVSRLEAAYFAVRGDTPMAQRQRNSRFLSLVQVSVARDEAHASWTAAAQDGHVTRLLAPPIATEPSGDAALGRQGAKRLRETLRLLAGALTGLECDAESVEDAGRVALRERSVWPSQRLLRATHRFIQDLSRIQRFTLEVMDGAYPSLDTASHWVYRVSPGAQRARRAIDALSERLSPDERRQSILGLTTALCSVGAEAALFRQELAGLEQGVHRRTRIPLRTPSPAPVAGREDILAQWPLRREAAGRAVRNYEAQRVGFLFEATAL